MFLRGLPAGLNDRWATFERLTQCPCIFGDSHFQFPTPGPSHFSADKDVLVEIERWMVMNQRLRWAFKRLVTPWLRRRLRPVNDTDLVTGDAPKTPVRLIDWRQRSVYTFEATTLMRTLREHLLYSCYLFPEPRFPRNPYTNQELSVGQLHFAIDDLMRVATMHWSLISFRNCSYAVPFFKTLFAEPLRLKAFHRVFHAPTGTDCIELTVDFIEMQFEYHGVPFPLPNMWFWALEAMSTDPYIAAWRSYAQSFYFLKHFPTLSKRPHAVDSELLQLQIASYAQIRQSEPFRRVTRAWTKAKQLSLSVLE